MALFTLLLITPWVWINVRGKPEDIGLQAEGAEDLAHTHAPGGEADPPGMKAIVRRGDFWSIGFAVGLLIAVFSSMICRPSSFSTSKIGRLRVM